MLSFCIFYISLFFYYFLVFYNVSVRHIYNQKSGIVSNSVVTTLKLCSKFRFSFNPFVPNAPFLYPMKTSENRKVFCFHGDRERVHWKRMGKNGITLAILEVYICCNYYIFHESPPAKLVCNQFYFAPHE